MSLGKQYCSLRAPAAGRTVQRQEQWMSPTGFNTWFTIHSVASCHLPGSGWMVKNSRKTPLWYITSANSFRLQGESRLRHPGYVTVVPSNTLSWLLLFGWQSASTKEQRLWLMVLPHSFMHSFILFIEQKFTTLLCWVSCGVLWQKDKKTQVAEKNQSIRGGPCGTPGAQGQVWRRGDLSRACGDEGRCPGERWGCILGKSAKPGHWVPFGKPREFQCPCGAPGHCSVYGIFSSRIPGTGVNIGCLYFPSKKGLQAPYLITKSTNT